MAAIGRTEACARLAGCDRNRPARCFGPSLLASLAITRRWCLGGITEAANALTMMSSLGAGRGQFRWRRWSVAVAMTRRRLAFCMLIQNKCQQRLGREAHG